MIESILAKINQPRDRDLITRAFQLAQKAHQGQFRAGGDPYITHPVAAAKMVANWKLDSAAIAACLLHDVVEDTPVTAEEIEKEFGPEVAFLVKGVTKLAQIEYRGKPDINAKQNLKAQSLRKLFFAMAEDIRVILIKLADRYHNLSTIGDKNSEGRQRISLETLEIYAPIAQRLGMGQIKGDLEDMAFPHAYPTEYQWLMSCVQDKYLDRQKYLKKFQPIILKKMAEHNLPVLDAHSRTKHYYSLYKKIAKQKTDLERIYDLVALRLVVPTIANCYEAMGLIHKSYKPLPGLIKDYIALPKLNGYRSIHTTVFGEKGKIVEIQIRTPEMHEYAENGIAAHWSYGESGKNKAHTANLKEAQWIAQLKNWLKETPKEEFYQSVKTNFFSDRVFILTPQGDVKDLPEGSTPLDFAYAVHTDIGHATKGARVNGKLVPLNYQLRSGEVVDIVKGKKPSPSLDWLTIVKTSEARKKIQGWLREHKADLKVVEEKKAETPILSPASVLKAGSTSQQKLFINGQHNILSTMAKCCSPLPGQKVIGYITKQKGISVHQVSCANLKKFQPRKLISVAWPEKVDYFPMRLSLTVKDKIGLLEEIGRVMRGLRVNILEIKNTPPFDGVSRIDLTVALKNQNLVQKLLQKLESNKSILSAKKS